jgi:hypothetical protein
MIRILFILLFIGSTASAQTKVAFGGTRPIDTAWAARFLRIDSALRLLKYSTSDSNKVLGFDANGNGILRTKGTGGGGGSTDSTVFYTVYRSDTSRANIYAAIAAGGGSTPTLQQVTDVGDTTDNSIIFKSSAEAVFSSGGGILLDNNSRLREGTISSINTANKGIAQICGVGYELKWAEGSQYVMNGNGNAIRVVNYRFNDTPTNSNDNLQGFYVSSRWVLDNGITYVCADATTGSAVWNRVSAITLTTTGTSGAATLTNDTLNIPQYAGATYTAGNRIGLNVDTFYLDTAGLFDYNFNAPSNLKLPTTAAVNSELANYVSAVRLADTAAAIRAAYVPYTGATTNVDLGTHNILPNAIQFDLTPTGTLTGIGTMYWDATNETVSIPLNNEVTLQVGQELHIRARNNTGVAITNGHAVYINDAQGNNPTIALANAKTLTTSFMVGVATEDIPDNTTGFVTTIGTVSGFNTAGFTDGDILYLDTVAGDITNVAPKHPYYTVIVGEALNSTNNGKIFVHAAAPIACDTTLSGNSNSVPPTQRAVKAALGTKQNYSDTATFDATKSWVNGRGFGTGTVTSVGVVAGTGVSIGGTLPVTTSGTYTVTNTAPDQTVTITASTNITVAGSYPTFTISATGGSSGPAKLKAVSPVTLTAGTGDTVIISISPNTTYTITEATAFTYSGANGLIQKITMNNALDTVTVDTATLVEGVTYELRVIQGSGGNKILHWANSYILFQGGTTATGRPYQDIGAADISRYFIQKTNALLFCNPVINNRN